jgi:plastocyanin
MWRIMFLVPMTSVLAAVAALAAGAAELRGSVRDEKGAVADAVIYATPSAAVPAASTRAVIDQFGKLYVPFVSVLHVGTSVHFPNRDNIKLHLYSVSPAKRFERPLYGGSQAEPVIFDKPGEVALGCNIHDWMVAHVLVLETPYAAVTDKAGRAVIADLPDGEYEVRVWHPGMKGKKKAAKNPRSISLNAAAEVDFKIRLKPKTRWWRGKPFDADLPVSDTY